MVSRRLLQSGEDARADFLDRANARDLAVLGSTRVPLLSPFRIVVHERPGLLLVDLQALSDRLFPVVVALDKGPTGNVVLAGNPGRIELDVIVASRCRMHAAPTQALDDLGVVYVDLQDEIATDNRGHPALERAARAAGSG